MLLNTLVVDGVHYSGLPSSSQQTAVDFRGSEMTLGLKGVLTSVAARSARRRASSILKLEWGGTTFCSRLLADHLLCLHELQRPFYIRYDDELGSTEETLHKQSSTVYSFATRHVKPFDWTPVSLCDWTDCVFEDGVAVAIANFTVNELEGTVEFDTAPTGVITASYVCHMPVVVNAWQLGQVVGIMSEECGPIPAYQGTVELLEVTAGLNTWPIYTGCLLEEVLGNLPIDAGDDDWFVIEEPPLPTISRRRKTITPTTTKTQPTCGNGLSEFEHVWPLLNLPRTAHLLKATYTATISTSDGGSFWIAPQSQSFDTEIIRPNASVLAAGSKRVGSELSAYFDTERLASYVSPYWSAPQLDWRWLQDKLNSTNTFDDIVVPAPLGPTLAGFLNYTTIEPDTDTAALMTAAGNTANYEFDVRGVGGEGSLDWEGAAAPVRYEVVAERGVLVTSDIEYRVWPGTPTSPIPIPTPPDTVEWVRAEARLTGSVNIRLRWTKAQTLGRLKKVKVTVLLECFAQVSGAASWNTDVVGKTKYARARIASDVEEIENPDPSDATNECRVSKTISEWVEFDEASQVGVMTSVSVEAAARVNSGSDTSSGPPYTAGTWDAQTGIYVELQSVTCGGQKIDLSDVQIEAEWIPLSLWPLSPDADGAVGGLTGTTFTPEDVVVLGNPDDPDSNLAEGDGFHGGQVFVPAPVSGSPALLFSSLDHVLRTKAPLHEADKVTGVRIMFSARSEAGTPTVSAGILPSDLSNVADWQTAQSYALTTDWQSFSLDLPYSALAYTPFTTISDLATSKFLAVGTDAFRVRNIHAAIYYIHEDV